MCEPARARQCYSRTLKARTSPSDVPLGGRSLIVMGKNIEIDAKSVESLSWDAAAVVASLDKVCCAGPRSSASPSKAT